MKIAQVCPLFESVPPKLYGGTERIVSYLTESLIDLGHEVTLFASGDSETRAKLISPCKHALRLCNSYKDHLVHHIIMLDQLCTMAHEFDFIHYHIDYLSFPLMRLLGIPGLSTLHGRLDQPDLVPLYKYFSEIPVVSISQNQRSPLPQAHWVGTIYHGLPENGLIYEGEKEGYLAFLGRICADKGTDVAIEIAKRANMKLKIAAKIDPNDQAYFENVITPLLDHPLIEFIGEIGEKEKAQFLGKAQALLFPISWPEPFGLVLIESLSCGTPVIATNCGSVPEIIDHGKTGFIVNNIEEAVQAARQIDQLSSQTCRETFLKRFSAKQMALAYVDLYKKLTYLHPSIPRVAHG